MGSPCFQSEVSTISKRHHSSHQARYSQVSYSRDRRCYDRLDQHADTVSASPLIWALAAQPVHYAAGVVEALAQRLTALVFVSSQQSLSMAAALLAYLRMLPIRPFVAFQQ